MCHTCPSSSLIYSRHLISESTLPLIPNYDCISSLPQSTYHCNLAPCLTRFQLIFVTQLLVPSISERVGCKNYKSAPPSEKISVQTNGTPKWPLSLPSIHLSTGILNRHFGNQRQITMKMMIAPSPLPSQEK